MKSKYSNSRKVQTFYTKTAFLLLSLLFFFVFDIEFIFGQKVSFNFQDKNGKKEFILSNNKIECSILFDNDKLLSENLKTQTDWIKQFGTKPFNITYDANFFVDVMFTDWQAPGKVNNAENPIKFFKKDFAFKNYEIVDLLNGAKSLNIFFKSSNSPLQVQLKYDLDTNSFYIKRKIAVCDSTFGHHFLRSISPLSGILEGRVILIKDGGFGQPVAFKYDKGGAFFGLEYPTAENSFKQSDKGKNEISCSQEMGVKIGKDWIESDWVVEALTPNSEVKLWFAKYLDDIRVAPLKPYTLYNSWYDLRSPEFKTDPANIMNEKNILRIIELLRKNMIEKNNIKLDAFVLDDGWDIYKSDWVLRKEEFPNGLTPIVNELKKTKTNLGLWFGPTGGYSFRSQRIEYMKDHGYEIVGDQLCIAGNNYGKLFKKRVTDFAGIDKIGYYKWDGIQFSCSEPDHGHPIDIYSRRAVMESVINICKSVREKNPDIFLNITSGTWLSPWWLKYANTIWMQGEDYGYSNIPSISKRDAAITYRDYVLYDDFKKNNFWFPIANLMTHGIIKGNLQKLGGEDESLDKFTDDVLLYFARGVSMYELYISPDLLTNREWDALGKSIAWAKDRFDILRSTEMIGGDPGKKEAYGYADFNGKRGIIAVRNPFITPTMLKIMLSPSLGLDSKPGALVLERVYPTHLISTRLYQTNVRLDLTLQGYETAIYEIYPLDEAKLPLLAGVTFDIIPKGNGEFQYQFFDSERGARLLNPQLVSSIMSDDRMLKPNQLSLPVKNYEESIKNPSFALLHDKDKPFIEINYDLKPPAIEGTLSILFEQDGKTLNDEEIIVSEKFDGKEIVPKIEKQKGKWSWYKTHTSVGKHVSQVSIPTPKNNTKWTGKISAWIETVEKPEITKISFVLIDHSQSMKPMPPEHLPIGQIHRNFKIGELSIK